MGKRYYCDYCDKILVASPSIVKTHNSGLVHQQLVRDHYQQYRDIESIYSEESSKEPCMRFAAGTCKFGSVCRFSHYTKEQMLQFQNYLAAKKSSVPDADQPSFEELYRKLQDNKSTELREREGHTSLLDPNGVTHILPWTYKGDSDSENLTPSLKGLEFKDFINMQIGEWGKTFEK